MSAPRLGSIHGGIHGGMVGSIITDFTEWLDDIGGEWWFLLVILAIAFFDSVIPVVPSETAVIIGGIAARGDGQPLPLVILAGAAGAFLGDNFAYLLGRRFSPWIHRRAESRPKTVQRLRWARNQIRTRGGPLLITARFIPGGRTALTVTSGITRQPRVWFAGWIGIAALIWATYASGLGYLARDRFKDNHTAAFLVAFGAALGITVVIELVRHFRKGAGPAEEAVTDVAEQAKDTAKEAVEERLGGDIGDTIGDAVEEAVVERIGDADEETVDPAPADPARE